MYNCEKEIKAIRWLNASEERDPTWWQTAWSLVPSSIDDPTEDVSWDDLRELDEDSATALCIEAALVQLRENLPEMQSEINQLIDDLDNRDGDIEELIQTVRENREEEENKK